MTILGTVFDALHKSVGLQITAALCVVLAVSWAVAILTPLVFLD